VRRARHLLIVTAAVFVLASCSDSEYTVADARDDLAASGFTAGEADCVIAGLEAFFVDEFIALQEARGIDEVSQAQIDNYVRNRFASEAPVTQAASDATRRLVAECRP
jgi:hypothetical protein